jgi:hypothetical protein
MANLYSVFTKTHQENFSTNQLFLLKLLVSFIFLGRAWESIFMNIPITELLWDEYLMHDFIEWLTANSWEHYVKTSDRFIQNLQIFIGICWLICGILLWTRLFLYKIVRFFYLFGCLLLFFLSFLYFKEMFFSWGQWAEYSLQVGSPIILYLVISQKTNNSAALRFFIQILIAVTFFSHGLYAFGYYPQPGAWIDWCMRVFFMSEKTARSFLVIIGILDMLKLLVIFIPLRCLQLSMIWYCVFWGFITALARIVANFSNDLPVEAFLQYAPETFFRLVHGGIPLLLILLWKSPNTEKN